MKYIWISLIFLIVLGAGALLFIDVPAPRELIKIPVVINAQSS